MLYIISYLSRFARLHIHHSCVWVTRHLAFVAMANFRFFLSILLIGPDLALAINDDKNIFDQNHNLPDNNKVAQVGRNGKGNPYSRGQLLRMKCKFFKIKIAFSKIIRLNISIAVFSLFSIVKFKNEACRSSQALSNA